MLDDVALTPKVIELQDVSIVAEKSEIADLSIETGHRAITSEAIRRIPASRNDIFRAIKYLPGVEGVDPISPLYAARRLKQIWNHCPEGIAVICETVLDLFHIDSND